MVISSDACAKAVVPANITERQMRCRMTLAVAAAFVCGFSIAAHAQAPAVVIPGSGVPGTGISNGAGAAGAGTGTVIGARPAAGHPAGTGGLLDNATEGSSTGGITGSGRGISTGTGGIGNEGNFGANTGGIKD